MNGPTHNLKVLGSNPSPATKFSMGQDPLLAGPALFASGSNLKDNLTVASALAQAGQALLALAHALGASPSPVPVPAAATESPSLLSLANEALVSKARGNRRHRYLLQLRSSWKLLADFVGDVPAASVTAADIDAWLVHLGVSPRTQRGYLTDARTLFNFAAKRGYVPASPADAVDMPTIDDAVPGIHSPAEVATILATAQRLDLGVARVLAIQYFAGIRPAEAAKLSEANVSSEWIEVPSAKAKSRQRRLVTVSPNLREWLALGGELPVPNLTKRWRAVRAAAGVPWSHDVTRHSFASYHLAQHRSQEATAAEMGHRSSYMLFRHYRALVSPQAAAEYWAIRPAA
jgi:hypothetical protein